MATLAFVLLVWAGKVNTPYDSYWLCLLLALDTQTLLRLWIYRRHG